MLEVPCDLSHHLLKNQNSSPHLVFTEESPHGVLVGFRNHSHSHSLHLWFFVSVVMPVSVKGSVGYRCPLRLHNHEYHGAHKEPRFFQLWHLWWQSGSGHRGRVSMVMAQLLFFLRIMVTAVSWRHWVVMRQIVSQSFAE